MQTALPLFSTLFLNMLWALILQAPANAEDFPKEEYDAQVREYLKSLENLSVEYTATDQTLDGNCSFRDEHSFISIPNYFRIKTTTIQTDKSGIKKTTEWTLMRPDGYYVISEKDVGQFTLERRDNKITSPLLMRETNSPIEVLIKPLCRASFPISELLAGKIEGHRLIARDFRRIEPKGTAAYALTTTDTINGGMADTEYELNDRWLLNRYKIQSRTTKEALVAEISYTALGDRQLPLRIDIKRIGNDGQLISPGFVAEFRNHKIYNGSPSDFSLTQFGLPESIDFQPPKSSRLWLDLTVLAVALLALAFALRQFQRRSDSPSKTK